MEAGISVLVKMESGLHETHLRTMNLSSPQDADG